jgi:hypothetical protein
LKKCLARQQRLLKSLPNQTRKNKAHVNIESATSNLWVWLPGPAPGVRSCSSKPSACCLADFVCREHSKLHQCSTHGRAVCCWLVVCCISVLWSSGGCELHCTTMPFVGAASGRCSYCPMHMMHAQHC